MPLSNNSKGRSALKRSDLSHRERVQELVDGRALISAHFKYPFPSCYSSISCIVSNESQCRGGNDPSLWVNPWQAHSWGSGGGKWQPLEGEVKWFPECWAISGGASHRWWVSQGKEAGTIRRLLVINPSSAGSDRGWNWASEMPSMCVKGL